jgi:multidrug efflux system membrane fusion protein
MKRTLSGLLLVASLLSFGGLTQAAEYPARVQWAERLVLSTPVSGAVTRVEVAAGQRVAAGDLLVELEQRMRRASLQQAGAELDMARQEHEEAQRELERTREMFDRTLLSVHDLQVAQIAAAGAQARFSKAEAAQTKARLQLEYSRVLAPYDARVVEVPVRTGQAVVNRFTAQPLVVLAPVGRMAAQASLERGQIAPLNVGDAARVRVGDAEYPGKVTQVGLEPETDPGRVLLYRLDVQFELPRDMLMRPGQSAQIEIPN